MVEMGDAERDGTVLVRFELPHAVVAESVCVVGEFNNWSHEAHPMGRDGDGFVATIPLEPGRAYRFRYLLDGERWENDWAADRYVPNEFGGDDSVVDLAGIAAITPQKKAAPRKRAASKATGPMEGTG
jgi:1,4-alpha-glucan branching enzyme